MTARKLVVAAALGTALGTVVVGTLAASRSASPPASSAPTAEIDPADSASPDATPRRSASGSASSGEPSRRSLSTQERREWTLRTLAEALASETRDEAWASATELALQRAAEVPGIRSIDAKCRQTMCQLAVTFEGSPSLRSLKELLLRPELSTSGYHALEADGRVIIYLAREGTNLTHHPHFEAAFAKLAAR